ncbi:hypothetical protein PHMEG_00017424 [Phytophthora megakarya]|uniref:Reverse transcriptase Ty1/copia-type domain-containing protein n=1 Tax=Phytophthora megakarya TaxID=4795 RepID=A0A225VWV4_9STRA|nr:hypothetical protein PHMEG_00017424 [Phytophthora megakarya]
MRVLRNRWIFRVKYLADEENERSKAPVVIKGYLQEFGIDYREIFSSVVRLETLRVLFTLAAIWEYDIDQMDVTTAFLNGSIDVEVFMEHPEEYYVRHLRKSLYGLKQAPRVWFRLLKEFLENAGYGLINCEACVAVKVINGWLIIISIYVDDLIFFPPNKSMMKDMEEMLFERFKMKNLGRIHYILGWEITRNRQKRTLFISQREYAEKVLQRFSMENCDDLKLSKVMCPSTRDEKALMKDKPYRAVRGSLMYLMLGTRPDLAYMVRECSQILKTPGVLHWRAPKRGLRYLKETFDMGLQLGGDQSDRLLNQHLVAFADADFANRVDDRKSVAGFLTQLCGSTISWCSQTERAVDLHTCEAEYMALSLLVQEVIYLRQIALLLNKSHQKFMWMW